MRRSRSRSALTLVALGALVGLVLGINPADAARPDRTKNSPSTSTTTRDWAPAADATITPGVQLYTDAGQCTANFIFTDGADVLIGFAAHCAGEGSATDTNGCDTPSLPLGSPVEIDGASQDGTLVYSSWLAMQQAKEKNQDACDYNDFALVRIDPLDHLRVNPSIPHWGGPTGLNTDGTAEGETIYSYGNSGLRLGINALSPKVGTSLGTMAGGWTHPVYTVSPGIPGDSGSAMLDEAGRAAGVLSTLAILPLAGSNNYSDLGKALEYMRAKSNLGAVLALGTEGFSRNRLPLATGR